MKPNILYKLNRGNQTEVIGFLIKGSSVSLELLGSVFKPDKASEMISLCDENISSNGAWPFIELPEFIFFKGEAEHIGIIGTSATEKSIINDFIENCGMLDFSVPCNSQYTPFI